MRSVRRKAYLDPHTSKEGVGFFMSKFPPVPRLADLINHQSGAGVFYGGQKMKNKIYVGKMDYSELSEEHRKLRNTLKRINYLLTQKNGMDIFTMIYEIEKVVNIGLKNTQENI